MEHLSAETLGRLVDDPHPTTSERAHLEACDVCASELDALRRQTALLSRLPDLRPFPADYDALEARLASEGLVRSPGRTDFAELDLAQRWIRRAAAVALFIGGAGIGAALMAGIDAPATGAQAALEPAADPTAALARVERAEQEYVAALVQYRQMTSEPEVEEAAGDPAARYAALEYLVRAGQVAVRQAPADPFLNGLLASALAEQQAVRRMSTSSPGQDGWF